MTDDDILVDPDETAYDMHTDLLFFDEHDDDASAMLFFDEHDSAVPFFFADALDPNICTSTLLNNDHLGDPSLPALAAMFEYNENERATVNGFNRIKVKRIFEFLRRNSVGP